LIEVSKIFQPRNILVYPPNNKQTFEEYFFDRSIKEITNLNRIYLPIFWTNYYISKNYGNGDISELQNLINSLDKTKKYFTIVQYDDNILNNLNDLDILIFAQGGYGKYKNNCYEIPLNCLGEISENNEKNIFASFVGRKTHQIRNRLFDMYMNNENFFISETINYNDYKNIMKKSIFSLCPRGYGLTSFRICESLQSESIPVYIYDEEFLPFKKEFDFNEIGIKLHISELHSLNEILLSKTKDDIENYIKFGKEIYKKYFTYEGSFQTIKKILT